MGFGGHALAMIQSMKQNKNILKRNYGKFNTDPHNLPSNRSKIFLKRKKLTDEQRAKYRQDAKESSRKDFMILYIGLALAIILIVYISGKAYHWF